MPSYCPLADADGNQREIELEAQIEVVDLRLGVTARAAGEPQDGGRGREGDADRDDARDVEGVGERGGGSGRDQGAALHGVRDGGGRADRVFAVGAGARGQVQARQVDVGAVRAVGDAAEDRDAYRAAQVAGRVGG